MDNCKIRKASFCFFNRSFLAGTIFSVLVTAGYLGKSYFEDKRNIEHNLDNFIQKNLSGISEDFVERDFDLISEKIKSLNTTEYSFIQIRDSKGIVFFERGDRSPKSELLTHSFDNGVGTFVIQINEVGLTSTYLTKSQALFLWFFSSSFLLTLFMSFLFERKYIRRLRNMTKRESKAYDELDFIHKSYHDEIEEKEKNILDNERRLRSKESLYQSTVIELMDTQSEIIEYKRAILHDLKNGVGGLAYQLYKNSEISLDTELILEHIAEIISKVEAKENKREIIEDQYLLVDQVIHEASILFEHRFKEKKINLIVDNLTDRGAKCFGSPTEVKEAIMNLISNAIKYSYKGSMIKIVAKKVDEYIVFDVIDQGVGLSKKEQVDLFDNSFEVKTGTCGELGIGQGLVRSEQNIKKNGGIVKVQSLDESMYPHKHGTTIRVCLKDVA